MLRHKSHYCTNSLSLCVRLCENCHFLFQSTYFESGVWGTCRLLFCPVSPSRGQVRSQELFSGGKQNLKIFTLRHVLAGCGPYTVCAFDYPVPSPIRICLWEMDVCGYERSDCTLFTHVSCVASYAGTWETVDVIHTYSRMPTWVTWTFIDIF